MVAVYHSIGRGGTIESVKKHGLLTRNELFRRSLSQDNPSQIRGVLPDQYDVIYFSPELEKPNDANIVGYLVDTNSTYVYNREYRFDSNQRKYLNSKVLLSTYLADKKLARQMQAAAPEGKTVIFDPRTSEPFYVNYSDKRYYCGSRFIMDEDYAILLYHLYIGEVIINKNCIPPEELIFFS